MDTKKLIKMQNEGVLKISDTPKTKSVLKIGKERSVIIELDIKFNKLQKIMWKKFFNIEIVDVKE